VAGEGGVKDVSALSGGLFETFRGRCELPQLFI
jgi:hypothetical protein